MRADYNMTNHGDISGFDEVKRDYERYMEAQVGELGVRMQEWARRADWLHLDNAENLKALQRWQKNAAQQLRELRHADRDHWDKSKRVLDDNWISLKAAWNEFKDSSSEFKVYTKKHNILITKGS